LAIENAAASSGIAVAILSPKINKLVNSTAAIMMNQSDSAIGSNSKPPIGAISIAAFGSLWLKRRRQRDVLV
jgi:hypothetical protein